MKIKELADKLGKKKIKVKSTFKERRLVVKIPDTKPERVLSDENRFFKGEFNKEKKRLFFQ